MTTVSFVRDSARTLPGLLLAGAVASGCSAAAPSSSAATTNATTEDLSVGVFGECELPTPLKPVLSKIAHALHSRGVEISGEMILVYDHDLTSGDNTVELLIGGAAAWSLGSALGLGSEKLQGMLDEVGGEAGILGSVTVGLDFGGDWEGINFALDAYSGADVFAGSGGRWKVIWSTKQDEVGQEGFWASVTVATDGLCKGGGVAFASDDDLNVLRRAWDYLVNGRK
jgi:hypothetical protein